MEPNQTMIVVKLLNGIYQLTKLNLNSTPDGTVQLPLTINAPVYSEKRKCKAVFYRKNKRNTWFYREVRDISDKMRTFA